MVFSLFHVTEDLVRFGEDLEDNDHLGAQFSEPRFLYSNLEDAFGVIGAYLKSEFRLKINKT